MRKEVRKHTVDTLSVPKHCPYYKYKKRSPDRSTLEWWRVQKIREHLGHMGEHSRLYKGMKRLSSYLVMDKRPMMEYSDEPNIVGIDREEAPGFAILAERRRNFSPKLKGVIVGPSPGTLGKQGIFLVSDDEKNHWVGYTLVRFLPRSLFETYSIAFFVRADSNLHQVVKSKNIQFHFSGIYEDTKEHRKRLGEIRPRILAGQPLLLLVITEGVRKGKTDICPRIVISIAEVLGQANEQRIKKVLGLSVIHQVYQRTEGCLTATCFMGTLYLSRDVVYAEREYLDDRRFVPVVTDLERKVQPIIRYRPNNILVEQKKPCGCGSPFPALEKVEGCEDDVFSPKGKDGRNMPVFPDSIRRCILFGDKDSGENQAGPSEDYRIVQEMDGRLTVYANMTDLGKQRALKEPELLSKDCGSLLLDISFQSYSCEKERKVKHVGRGGAESVRGRYT